MTAPADPHAVLSISALESLYPASTASVSLKVIDHIDDGLRDVLALSPLCFLATASAAGHLDCSPRGDPAGTLQVPDPYTLLLPDRPGNNRLDSLRNIVENPEVGLIFLLPGVNEVVRVNGRARLSTDPELLGRFEVAGKLPRLVISIAVREAFMHCPRAFSSAELWNPERHLTPQQRPDFWAIYTAHVARNAALTGQTPGRSRGQAGDLSTPKTALPALGGPLTRR
jgi:PPOX class probable FMN-dependent enzyme